MIILPHVPHNVPILIQSYLFTSGALASNSKVGVFTTYLHHLDYLHYKGQN